jgi:hypothetical protein
MISFLASSHFATGGGREDGVLHGPETHGRGLAAKRATPAKLRLK